MINSNTRERKIFVSKLADAMNSKEISSFVNQFYTFTGFDRLVLLPLSAPMKANLSVLKRSTTK